jgi:DNA-binding NtrC family response regulator
MGLNTPVIMITGQPDIDNAASALRHGAFDYIVKPIRRETLLRVTKHAFSTRPCWTRKESSSRTGALPGPPRGRVRQR